MDKKKDVKETAENGVAPNELADETLEQVSGGAERIKPRDVDEIIVLD